MLFLLAPPSHCINTRFIKFLSQTNNGRQDNFFTNEAVHGESLNQKIIEEQGI
jgi:hypothetical protein